MKLPKWGCTGCSSFLVPKDNRKEGERMAKKEYTYNTSLTYDRNNPEDMECVAKMKNRDRSKYHSIPQYVRAAVLAFDDKNPKINYSDAAKQDLLNEIKAELTKQNDEMKTYSSIQ